jgi:hypothetical protein
MSLNVKFSGMCVLVFFSASVPAAKGPSMPEVLAAASPADWEDSFQIRAGRIDLSNVPIAVRERRAAAVHSP